MRIGSLFSGAGGLDMAVEAVFGGRTVFHCEPEKIRDTDTAPWRHNPALTVLSARRPGVPNLGDITAVDWTDVEPVDVLCGGFPCQDVSAAGRRAGIAHGTRSGLWAHFADAIAVLRPRIVVIENVRGLLSARAHRAMESAQTALGNDADGLVLRALGAVLGDLSDIGYDAQWCTVAASDVGAPHRRERVFIVAHPAGDGRHERRPESAGLAQRPDAALSGAGHVDLLPTPTGRDGKGANQRGDETCLHGALLPTPRTTDAKGARVPRGTAHGDDLRTAVALLPTPSKADGDGGHLSRSGSRSVELLLPGVAREMATNWGKYELAIRRWESLTRPAPPPTEPNSKGKPRLHPPFPEWMMGWPAGWVTDPTLGISRNDQLRLIGNGVVPQQARAAVWHLLSIYEVAA